MRFLLRLNLSGFVTANTNIFCGVYLYLNYISHNSSMVPNMRKRMLLFAAFATVVSRPAYGYIDPGVGSVMVQAILAGSAGVIMVLKLYWRRIAVRLGLVKELEEGQHPE